MALSKPLLPVDFVRQVESDPVMSGYPSAVYQRSAHEERLAMRNWIKPLSPDHPVANRDSSRGFTVEARRTTLHLGALDGDVLAVSELLRLGAAVDTVDSAGITPLYLTMSEMSEFKSLYAEMCGQDRSLIEAVKNGLARLAWVARILIEQHADVNRSVNGTSILHIACTFQGWDTIALLLKHGARPTPSFPQASDRLRFSELVKSIGTNHTRPPRPCPCWSGKIVSACHGKEAQPYPLEFVCVCGSGKTYGRCCYRRRNFVVEKWDNTSQRILHDYDRLSKLSEPMREQMASALAMRDKLEEIGRRMGRKTALSGADIQKKISKDLLSKGVVDPAFAYALTRVEFIPKPQGRTISRHMCEQMQRLWNARVDEYILQGGDQRSRWDIERAAKIGTWGGALIRVCEGVDCEAVEGRDVERLKLCSRCKISVYCSAECQRSAWRTHKAICGSKGQLEQSLPSQDAIKTHLQQTQPSMEDQVALSQLRALTFNDEWPKDTN